MSLLLLKLCHFSATLAHLRHFHASYYRLVMGVLTLPAFPVSVLGTVVNKKARYSLLRPVKASEKFTYR